MYHQRLVKRAVDYKPIGRRSVAAVKTEEQPVSLYREVTATTKKHFRDFGRNICDITESMLESVSSICKSGGGVCVEHV